ncbi:MAG: hypothetical protein HQL89_18760 [Magnetococcales bacterium]|nr:hypothetical protein [Magnetococcales bacterium]
MKRILLFLGALLFAPQLLADPIPVNRYYNLSQSSCGFCTWSPAFPTEVFVDKTSTFNAVWLNNRYTVQYIRWGKTYNCYPSEQYGGLSFDCKSGTEVLTKAFTVAAVLDTAFNQLAEETATCTIFDGEQIAGTFNSETPRCIDFGHTKGGTNPAPLYCMSRFYARIGNEIYHALTSEECTEPTPDDTPPDTGGGDTGGGTGGDTGGGDTGGGTGGDTGGGTGGDTTTDYTAITSRLDAMRADAQQQNTQVLDKLDTSNQQQVAAANQVTNAVNGTTQSVQGLNTQLSQQTVTQQQLLSEVQQLRSDMQFGNNQLGQKLDGIRDELGKLNEGTPVDPNATVEGLQLPDPKETIDHGMDDVMTTLQQQVTDTGLERLGSDDQIKSALSNAQSIEEFFNVASSNCSPIIFGRSSLNFCDAAPRISAILELIIWGLTLIFLIQFFGSLLSRDKISW